LAPNLVISSLMPNEFRAAHTIMEKSIDRCQELANQLVRLGFLDANPPEECSPTVTERAECLFSSFTNPRLLALDRITEYGKSIVKVMSAGGTVYIELDQVGTYKSVFKGPVTPICHCRLEQTKSVVATLERADGSRAMIMLTLKEPALAQELCQVINDQSLLSLRAKVEQIEPQLFMLPIPFAIESHEYLNAVDEVDVVARKVDGSFVELGRASLALTRVGGSDQQVWMVLRSKKDASICLLAALLNSAVKCWHTAPNTIGLGFVHVDRTYEYQVGLPSLLKLTYWRLNTSFHPAISCKLSDKTV
jgi:hypothetical protein